VNRAGNSSTTWWPKHRGIFKNQMNVSLRVNKLEDLVVGRDLGDPITNKETSAGKNFHILSDMIKSPARVNVFLVWEWNPDDGNADAEANQIGGKFIIFEDNLVAGTTPGRLLGHERPPVHAEARRRCQGRAHVRRRRNHQRSVAQGRNPQSPQRNMSGREAAPPLTEIGLSG